MVTIKILNADKTPYWTMSTDTRAECDKWLQAEKTRPYWKADFIVEIDDKTAEVEAALAASKIEVDKKKVLAKTRATLIADLRQKKTWTPEETRAAFDAIIDCLELENK